MTTNQINYWANQEVKRANQAQEKLKKYDIDQRTSLGRDTLAETNRSNLARELETNRHNLATEGQTAVDLGIKQQEADTHKEQLGINWASLAEVAKHNRAQEAIGIQTLNENYRANTARETTNAFLALQNAKDTANRAEQTKLQEYANETQRMQLYETNRSNLADETERNRHNVATETETNRNNLVMGTLKAEEVSNQINRTKLEAYNSAANNVNELLKTMVGRGGVSSLKPYFPDYIQ